MSWRERLKMGGEWDHKLFKGSIIKQEWTKMASYSPVLISINRSHGQMALCWSQCNIAEEHGTGTWRSWVQIHMLRLHAYVISHSPIFLPIIQKLEDDLDSSYLKCGSCAIGMSITGSLLGKQSLRPSWVPLKQKLLYNEILSCFVYICG